MQFSPQELFCFKINARVKFQGLNAICPDKLPRPDRTSRVQAPVMLHYRMPIADAPASAIVSANRIGPHGLCPFPLPSNPIKTYCIDAAQAHFVLNNFLRDPLAILHT
jgi:hypothetical protein